MATFLVRMFRERNRTRRRARRCGHSVGQAGVEYCAACLRRMATICACCEQVICIGDEVRPTEIPRNRRPPEAAEGYSGRSDALVACMREGCAPQGATPTGTWSIDHENKCGFVRRYTAIFTSHSPHAPSAA